MSGEGECVANHGLHFGALGLGLRETRFPDADEEVFHRLWGARHVVFQDKVGMAGIAEQFSFFGAQLGDLDQQRPIIGFAYLSRAGDSRQTFAAASRGSQTAP